MSVTVSIADLTSSGAVNVLGNNVYEIEKDDSKLILEVLKIDLTEKSITIRSNHRTHDLIFKDQLDLVLDKMGIKRTSELVNKNVKAPMPGKVLELLAKEGDTLSKGDNILILEAMKMENVIKAEVDCVIKKIHISSQQNVEKNQVLIELDFI
jgi:acetyl/propionyl-CoA carboxylase alpha subunit